MSATNSTATTAAVAALSAIADPSSLTTAQIQREASRLEALQQEKIASLVVRLDAMDRAQHLFHEDLTRVPTQTDKAVGALKELVLQTRAERVLAVEEKFVSVHARFQGIQLQFTERDTRAEQTSRDSTTAINAALAAAKEAVQSQTTASEKAINKSEDNFTKQIDQLTRLLNEMRSSLNDKNDDVKSRLLLIEGKTVGQGATQATQNTDRSFVVALIGVGLSALAFLSMVALNLLKA